jgi:Flp pilus assembly protein TadG
MQIYSQAKYFSCKDQGAISIIFAFAIIPILGFLGLGLDLGRLYYVNSVLGGAVDAAAIAGGHTGGTTADIQNQATAIFNANIPKNLISSISAPTITVTQNNTVVKVAAAGQINTYFLPFFGVSTLTTVSSSVALVTTKGAEVVLALDNTGSMQGSPMQDEINAANQLVNILFGGNGTSGGSDTINGLAVAVVPYSTTVNISGIPNYKTWLSASGQQQIKNTNLYPNIAPVAGKSVGGQWMGCIEARAPLTPSGLTSSQITSYGYENYPQGTDATDATPTQYPFSPFLYPSTMIHQYVFGKPLNRGTTSTATTALATPPWGSTGSTRGDNDWKLNGTVPSGSGLYFGDNYAWNSGNPSGNSGVGPNLGCPVPLLSLQTSQTKVKSTINSMLATFRGGTMINLGLNAAWWTISPNWNGTWSQPTPAPSSGVTFPQPYDNTLKVVVLMTDGQNQWYDLPTGVPGAPDTSHNYKADADYTGYGRLAEGRSGTTVASNTGTVLNSSMLNMCTSLKNNKVVIYTIIFTHGGNVDSNTQSLFQSCATDSNHYYFAPNSATLVDAFKNIGQQITNLRLGWAPNY